MILFYQLKANAPGATGEDGLIVNKSVSQFKRMFINKLYNVCKSLRTFSGNVVNLETGEIYSRESNFNLPQWLTEPLLRQMKLAEWKANNLPVKKAGSSKQTTKRKVKNKP